MGKRSLKTGIADFSVMGKEKIKISYFGRRSTLCMVEVLAGMTSLISSGPWILRLEEVLSHAFAPSCSTRHFLLDFPLSLVRDDDDCARQ